MAGERRERLKGRGFVYPTLLILSAACLGSDCHWQLSLNSPEGRSTLLIRVTTSGAEIDPDGYLAVVRGSGRRELGSRVLPANGRVELELRATTGDCTVELTDLAPNCVVGADNPQSVRVVPGQEAEVKFDVTCRTGGS